MLQKALSTVAGLAVAALALPASVTAAPTLDGTTSDTDYVSLGKYTQAHGFGDHGLKEMFGWSDATNLYVGINGESEDNFNGFFLFIDHDGSNGVPAGTPLPGTSASGEISALNNSVLDFEVDWILRIATGPNPGDNFVNIADYTTGGDPVGGTFLGSFNDDGTSYTLSDSGYTASFSLQDPANLSGTTDEGLEVAIPHSTLGGANGDTYKLMVAYISSDGNFWSSDTIPEVPGLGGTNLGGDPNLIDQPDRQWAAFDGAIVGVPQPSTNTAFTSGTIGDEISIEFGDSPTVPVVAGDFSIDDNTTSTATSVSNTGGNSYLVGFDGALSGDLTSDTLTYDNGNDDLTTASLYAGLVDLADIRAAVLASPDNDARVGSGGSIHDIPLTVKGVVIENFFDSFNGDNSTIQQGSFGIGIRDGGTFDLPANVTVGNEVIFSGNMDQFNGLAQITAGAGLLSDQGSVGTPALATLDSQTATADDYENAESTLYTLENVTFDDGDGSTFFDIGGGGVTYTINGSDPLISVRVDRDVESTFESGGDGPNNERLIPSTQGSVSGVGGQFTFSSPANDGYQVLPRNYSDLDFPPEPSSVHDWMMLND